MPSKPYDVVPKHLIEMHPQDWLELLGLPRQPVRMLDADLATVSAAADKVMLVGEDEAFILQPDVQSTYEEGLPGRQLLYSVLIRHRTGKVVRSVAILLRPDAD